MDGSADAAVDAGHTTWIGQTYFKASNPDSFDYFGAATALSDDGTTLVVGAANEASNATGANGNQLDNSLLQAGAVYVFVKTGSVWAQQAYLKASNAGQIDTFGTFVSVSADGNILAVAAPGEFSNALGINGDQADDSAAIAGAVYVFARSAEGWTQTAYLKASNTEEGDSFGSAMALSRDGRTLAVGARGEDSGAAGVDGNQADNTSADSGAVYVFTSTDGEWSQQGYLKASNTGVGDNFGWPITISSTGDTLAIAATTEASLSPGVNSDQGDDAGSFVGAVYVFERTAGTWSQQAYLKASNAETNDFFGAGLSMTADGNTLAVSADYEASSAVGVNGDQNDNAATGAGAVYVFGRTGTAWAQQTYLKASNTGADDRFGIALSLSGDGSTLAVGAVRESSDGADPSNDLAEKSGAVYLFSQVGSSWLQALYVKAQYPHPFDNFGDSVSLSFNGNTLMVGSPFESSNAQGIDGDQTDTSIAYTGAVFSFER